MKSNASIQTDQNKISIKTVKTKHAINKHNIIEQLQIQSMVWPGIIFLIIFAYLPIAGITIAFREYNIITGLQGAQWIGFKYFREFFTDPNFFNVLRNTFFLNILNLIIGFPAPIIFAVLIMEIKNIKFKKVSQTVSYLPHFLSWVIFGGLVMDLLSPNGAVNELFVGLGIFDKPFNFMGKGEYFYLTFTVISIIKSLGFSSILYIAAITGVDHELYEAARVDGCNRFQKVIYITIPSILGTIVIMFIFQISSMLNTGIEQLLVLQNQLNLPFSETIDTYVYKVGLQQMRFSYSSAVGIFKSVVSVILLVGANWSSKKLTDRGLF